MYISIEANKYSSDNIPRRYAFDGTNDGRNFNVQRYNHLPSATSRFHFEHGEINFESSSRDRISWSDSKLCEIRLSLPEQRIKRIQDQCQDLYVKGLVTVLELTKLLASTVQAVLPARLNFRYLQEQQINVLKLNGSYQEALSLNKESRKELQRWIQNLKLCNGRLITQCQSFVIIKIDASNVLTKNGGY